MILGLGAENRAASPSRAKVAAPPTGVEGFPQSPQQQLELSTPTPFGRTNDLFLSPSFPYFIFFK